MGIEDLNLDLQELADTILVISEDSEIASRITNVLQKRQYKWKSTANIQDASDVAQHKLFDMIVLDTKIPEMSPAEVFAALRAAPGLNRAPVIILHPDPDLHASDTANLSRKDLHVLKKPFEATELLVKLSTQLRLKKIKASSASLDAKVQNQNAQLRDLTNRFKKELRDAQQIQQSLLPKSLPRDENCIFAARYVPLEAVGGDLYDIYEIEEGLYGFFIGDVTGHGLSAAFIGAMTKMALAYADKASPETMLQEMAFGITDHMPEGTFVTVAAATYRPSTGSLKIAKGGHPPPYLYRAATGELETINPRGMPLGFMKEAMFELTEVTVEPGDKFLMITDGLTETTDMSGEMIGVEGVGKHFQEAAKELPIEQCLDEVLRRQDEFCGGRILKDDNTLVGFERS